MSLPNPLVVLGGVGSPYTRKMLSYLRYKRIPHKMIWGDPSKYLDILKGLPKSFYEECVYT